MQDVYASSTKQLVVRSWWKNKMQTTHCQNTRVGCWCKIQAVGV